METLKVLRGVGVYCAIFNAPLLAGLTLGWVLRNLEKVAAIPTWLSPWIVCLLLFPTILLGQWWLQNYHSDKWGWGEKLYRFSVLAIAITAFILGYRL